MTSKPEIVAVIPARGGSIGITRKNLRECYGKPLIYWSIRAAEESRYVSRIIVSTDDEEIADVAKSCGAEVPFMRPAELATSTATGPDVWRHALMWLGEQNQPADESVYLQPTTPVRTSRDIDNALDLLHEKQSDSIVSVCECEHHPYYTNVLPEDFCMRNFVKDEIKNTNRQELPVHYRLNGAVYAANVEFFCQSKYIIGDNTYAYVMPKESSVDIDEEIDFVIAEALLRKRKCGAGSQRQ